ncbi:MAG: hypothetical protein ACRDHD_06675 [Candidatus Limnocylindria bacterium]
MIAPRPTIAAAMVGAALLAACGEATHFGSLDQAAEHYGIDPAALTVVDDHRTVAAVAGEAGSVELWGFSRESAGWTRSLRATRQTEGEAYTVFLVTQPAGDVWAGSYAFGTAGADAARVTLDRTGEVGGAVRDGHWTIVGLAPAVAPAELSWRFLGADGTPLRVGIGEVPPQP